MFNSDDINISSAKLLIVEDDPIVAFGINTFLKKQGIQNVTYETNPKSVLKAFQSQKPDIALIDINLNSPITGIDLAKSITSEYDTEIIYITAYQSSNIMDSAQSTLPAAFLTKPFKEVDLWASIHYNIKIERLLLS